ncbi:D-glycero-beta-D-manno-heptose-7-phosphate kinase [Haliovirga abyssi]|uniref:ADP-heptose synthase n=1 Tax=Haliovirga abyssi TaxID=2996794 RepID=A0AAU9D9Q5_9FUSO|nr:D-glycero-beta-D-manno-heptose-7-phosphate kinase [Haliovirga abyssi]BDU51363.1 ADP-heptose synthase [Haliovirga abyssi]
MVDKKKLLKTLENFENKKIAVVGDFMLDEYIFGNVDRISPEAPVPVVNVTNETFVLGGAANVVNNLCSLGAKVVAFGVIGEDKNGEKMEMELEKRGVDTSGIFRDKDRPTIVKKRIIAHNQQLLRLDWEDKNEIIFYLEDELLNSFKSKISNIDAIILSDYDKGVLTPKVVKTIIEIANKNNKIVIVDPKPKNKLNYIGATSMTPNTKEALNCLDNMKIRTEDDFKMLGYKLKDELNLKNLLITRSEKGMSIFEDNIVEDIPTMAKEVYDVTGAGDTVIAVFTLSASAGASFYEAAKIANTAAGVVVGRIGTSTVTREEIVEFYDSFEK